MSGYAALAEFYDRLMGETDYESRASYLLQVMAYHGLSHPEMLLDLACGSGNLTVVLAEMGIDMIGVDGSGDMLAKAQMKPQTFENTILYLQQDMRELDLYGTVNGAVCGLDGLNHLLSTADIKKVLQRLRLFIEPGGLFVFDANTVYKHREVLANNAFVFEEEDFMCVWQNRLLPRTCEVDMQLDFFVDNGEGYDRYTDEVRERAYSVSTWKRMLQECGFDLLAVYGDMTMDPPSEDEERIVLVAQNRKE